MWLDYQLRYNIHCLSSNAPGSIFMGSLFTGLDVARGAPLSFSSFGRNVGFIFLYGGLICPMEAITGRKSSMHNALSGATVGYLGVQKRFLGIPGVDALFFYRYPRISPPMMGAAVYGAIGGIMATLLGKPL